MPKLKDEINVVDPENVVASLMTKWVVKACESSTSNLHELLRYRLSNFQPYQCGRWAPSLEFFILPLL